MSTMLETEITAIILAAGYSSRMGDFKPLLRLGNVTVIQYIISMFQKAGLKDIRVVIGFKALELSDLLKESGIRLIINDRFEEGMFSSVIAGVNTLEASRGAFFLMPVDIPLVRYQTVVELMRRFQESDKEILYPCFRGKRGHPPLISVRLLPDIKSYHGKGGLRAFLRQYEEMVDNIAVIDESVLYDMDEPLDYKRVLKRYEKYDIPGLDECIAVVNGQVRVKRTIA